MFLPKRTTTAPSLEPRPSAIEVFREESLAMIPPTVIPLDEGEILVKVEAMLQDPSDWKCDIDLVTQEPAHKTHGRDFSGIVVQLGGSAACGAGICLGDQVAGFVLASSVHSVAYPGRKEGICFVRMDADLAWVVPKGSFSHKQAAESRLGRYRYMFGIVPR